MPPSMSGWEKAEASEGDIKTVVQPDLVIVCDPSKLDEKGCLGTPNIIIEIISPATASHDYITKLKLYEQSGVPEYWIVHPLDRIVMIYRLTADGTYGKPEISSQENSVRMGLFEDFSLGSEFDFFGIAGRNALNADLAISGVRGLALFSI